MCASLLIASGATDMRAAHQMGHSTAETTKNMYGHLFAQDRASVLTAGLLNGPVDRPWGMRTASFTDPGGHIWELAQSLDNSEGS